jgi:hypothetical protein
VFEKPVIRICQFHVAQAIGRADFHSDEEDTFQAATSENPDTSTGNTSKKTTKARLKKKKTRRQRGRKLSVCKEARNAIVRAFRRIQRYRASDEEPFESYLEAFRSDVRNVCKEYGIVEAVQPILDYFDRNWFSDLWRRVYLPILCESSCLQVSSAHVLDEGLPEGQTRDGTWNTNNWVESSFRTFKQVFLENRKNKR